MKYQNSTIALLPDFPIEDQFATIGLPAVSAKGPHHISERRMAELAAHYNVYIAKGDSETSKEHSKVAVLGEPNNVTAFVEAVTLETEAEDLESVQQFPLIRNDSKLS